MQKYTIVAATAATLLAPCLAAAQESEIDNLKQEIRRLDERLKQTEQRQTEGATTTAPAESTPPASLGAVPSLGASAFNPAISLILSGLYTNLSEDPADYRISGFHVSPDVETGPGGRGLSLAESELGIYTNIDPYFYGGLNFAMAPDNTVSVEEAFVQTIGLSQGVTVKAGRFFSGIGYLNEQHAHVWDFVDSPLAYQAFLGGQLKDDGVQLRWLAPTETYIQIGAEFSRGENFPGSGRDKNGVGASAIYVHIGGDVGISHSWRGGVSMLQTTAHDRAFEDTDTADTLVTNAFSGISRLWAADFVWKYSPKGNPYYSNFKLQGEYLRRNESGDVTYDVDGTSLGASTARYDSMQSGWYLQAIYQFRPYWRVGVRTEQLDAGSVDYAANNVFISRPDYKPTKNSVMLDFSPSEFSRIRLQYSQDKSRQEATDDQVFVQYVMSLGAHGAHQF